MCEVIQQVSTDNVPVTSEKEAQHSYDINTWPHVTTHNNVMVDGTSSDLFSKVYRI